MYIRTAFFPGVEPLEEESLEGMQVRGHDHEEHEEEEGVHLEHGGI